MKIEPQQTNRPRLLSFYIWGYYGSHNTGDDAMLTVIVDFLRQQFPDCLIGVTCEDPEWIKEQLGDKVSSVCACAGSFSIQREWGFVQRLSKADIILMGGGTFFQDYGKHWINLLFRFFRMAALKLYGKKVLIIGAGVANLQTLIGKILTRLIVTLANGKCCFRDEESISYLQQLGVKPSKIQLTADLTFIHQHWTILDKKQSNLSTLDIGISVLPYFEEILCDKKQSKQFINWLSTNLDRLADLFPVRFHFISMKGGVSKNDYNYSERIIQSMGHSDLAVRYPYHPDANDTVALISKMDICLGMRLHFLLFSFLANIPTAAISYNQKVDSFMTMIGSSENCLPCNENLFVTNLVPIIERMTSHKGFHKNREEKLESLRVRAQSNFDEVVKLASPVSQ